ncbi:creatininase family protein, partial [Rhizobium ruizarguesonis]
LSETVVVLPIAAVEQHGPHLPLQVDAAINAAIIDRMVPLFDSNADVLILPAFCVGKSDEHLAYPLTPAG